MLSMEQLSFQERVEATLGQYKWTQRGDIYNLRAIEELDKVDNAG